MPLLFSTERLSVRHLTREDFQELHRMHSDPQVMRYVGGVLSAEANRDDVEKIIAGYTDASQSFLIWVIERRDDHMFVGTCALIINDEGEHEIGYRLSQTQWGNGFGLEVTNGLIAYAFETLKLEELVAYVEVNNAPSARILDRSPFQFEKEYYNDKLDSMDRRYTLSIGEWGMK